MLSSILNNLALYGNYIFFSAIVLIVIGIVGTSALQMLNWQSKTMKIYGVFAGIKRGKLIALSVLLVRLLFLCSVLFLEKKLELTYLLFVIIATMLLNLFLAEIRFALMDILYMAVLSGSIYSVSLLKKYLFEIQFQLSVLLMVVAIYVFVIAVSLYDVIGGTRSILKVKVKDGYRFKVKALVRPGLIILIGICFVIIPYNYMNQIVKQTIKGNLFQYTSEGRVDYYGESQVTKSGLKSVIENSGKTNELSDTPLYYSEKEQILLPSVISIVQPKISLTNRLANMSRINKKDGNYYVEDEKNSIQLSDFFLYDGKDTYLFFEPITITWNNQEMKISPFSFVSVKYNQMLTVYNREEDAYSQVKTGSGNVTTTMNCGVKINLSTDIISKPDGQEQMLFLQPNLLEDLK